MTRPFDTLMVATCLLFLATGLYLGFVLSRLATPADEVAFAPGSEATREISREIVAECKRSLAVAVPVPPGPESDVADRNDFWARHLDIRATVERLRTRIGDMESTCVTMTNKIRPYEDVSREVGNIKTVVDEVSKTLGSVEAALTVCGTDAECPYEGPGIGAALTEHGLAVEPKLKRFEQLLDGTEPGAIGELRSATEVLRSEIESSNVKLGAASSFLEEAAGRLAFAANRVRIAEGTVQATFENERLTASFEILGEEPECNELSLLIVPPQGDGLKATLSVVALETRALETRRVGRDRACVARLDITPADAQQLTIDLAQGGRAMVHVVRSDAAEEITIKGPLE